MKKLIMWMFLIMLLTLNANAETIDTDALNRALSGDAEKILYGVSPQKANIKQGASQLLDSFTHGFKVQLRHACKNAFLILIICALLSFAETFAKANNLSISQSLLDLFALCALLSISFGSFNSILQQCASAIDALGTFWKVLMPVFATACAVAGSPASAITSAGATLLFSGVLIELSANLLLPAIYIYIAACAAAAVIQNSLLAGVAQMIKWSSVTFFKGFLVVFTIYLSLSGIISGSADAVAVKTAQVTISSVVPVLGSIVADTSEAILTGATVLKGAVGIYGFLAACAFCLTPFVAALSQYLAYKVLAAVSASLAGGASGKIITGIADGYGIAIGLLGTCCAVQFISIVVSTVVMHR